MSELSTLHPQAVWHYFDEITCVPRPSKHEEKIITYLEHFAKEHSLKYRKDAVGNIVIFKSATSGMEDRPTVILQSHVDMVCEKNSDITFDFHHDAIRTHIENGWVKATGTTLGADCGIGMAAALALLAATEIPHGALEALFTVDEETGLTGAFGLADNMLSGKYLINLDSEDEGEIFIGCAGGIDTIATYRYKRENAPKGYIFFRIDIRGLKGGHSGDDIEKGHGNSNKLLNRFLWQATRSHALRLCYFDGGNLRNAIPREAYAVFGVPTKSVNAMEEYFAAYSSAIREEFLVTEPDFEVSISEIPSDETVIDVHTQGLLLNALCGLPNGVLAMSHAVDNLVETSTNLASVKFVGERVIEVTTSQRSAIESARNEAAASIESVFTLSGADVEHSEGYPGWSPNPDSSLLRVTQQAYRDLFGCDAKIRAIHAGLECGLFLKKYPWLEMVSFGPTLRGVHSPDERLDIASVDKFWALLIKSIQLLPADQ